MTTNNDFLECDNCASLIWDNSQYCVKCGNDMRVYIVGYETNYLEFTSTGFLWNCPECQLLLGIQDYMLDEFKNDLENGNIEDSGSFSHSSCDECNTPFGGQRYTAHGFDKNGDLIHFSICGDCLQEMNGNETSRKIKFLDEEGEH